MLVRAALVIALVVAIQYVDGTQRIIYVSKSNSDQDLTSDDSSELNEECCYLSQYGNCSCHSLYHALANLTSNVLINITTDVTLSLLAEVFCRENISIIGHNNPTVNCTNNGALNITSCHNCIIQGITWDGCGTEHEPGLLLRDSSNITIQNCSFQHSRGQAVVLSQMSDDMNINHCKFMNNTHYIGHGAAIHYYSSNKPANSSKLLFMTNCNFTHNEWAKSLVYVENKNFDHSNSIVFDLS